MAAGSGLPVRILAGRRAVGKTTLLQNLTLANGQKPEYFSFSADTAALRAAKRDPQEWLSRLPNHSVIDEAQLLPGVTQNVKAVVDRVGDAHRFILCGSAAIGRSRPGESDWLTGRAQRLELLPFSASELAARRFHRVIPWLTLCLKGIGQQWLGVGSGQGARIWWQPCVMGGCLHCVFRVRIRG